MPKIRSITVRNVPESVHRKLKARAESLGLSLNALLLEELVDIAARESIDDVLERILATAPVGAPARERVIDLT